MEGTADPFLAFLDGFFVLLRGAGSQAAAFRFAS